MVHMEDQQVGSQFHQSYRATPEAQPRVRGMAWWGIRSRNGLSCPTHCMLQHSLMHVEFAVSLESDRSAKPLVVKPSLVSSHVVGLAATAVPQ